MDSLKVIQEGDDVLYQKDSMSHPRIARVQKVGMLGLFVRDDGSAFEHILCLRTDWVRVLPWAGDGPCNFTLPELEIDYDGPIEPIEWFEE